MTNLLTVINSDPSMAAKAYAELYHGKTFAIGRSNGHIDTFKKTLRGAEGYMKREQSGSYYDEYSNEMVSYGAGMFIEEIKESDILNPAESIVLWFNYLRNIQGQEYLYTQALRTAEYLSVSDEVMNYVVSSIDDMRNYRGLTVIEEVSEVVVPEQIETIEVVAETPVIENDVIETIQNNNEITYQTGTGLKGNGIEITFTSKPTEEVRNLIKSNGYRWGGKNRSNIWWAILNDETLSIAENLAGGKTEEIQAINEPVTYPEIEIDDNDTYTINQQLQDREHDANWVMRKNKIDHNQQIQEYFTQLTNEVKQIILTTENEYFIYKLKKTLQYYKKHYFTNYVSRLTNKADSPSWVTTGSAGRNRSRDQKYSNRYDKLMQEWIDLDNDYKSRINSIKNKIRNEKKTALRNEIENTNVNIEFKTETKEFTYMNIKEKKRVYVYGEYFICKLWNCFRLFHKGNEININLKTTDSLETAKKALSLYIQQQEQKAS